ncbi:nucleolar protein 6-like [Aphidius gifuensis]|uniref:nucleolar protein 6-like n=1 Tax=Aphidius gifuensis TaxID=684658 RepID=UPI001CDCC6ED|nr:nucleolar protein 6-like [Aphidius gifuensis]
MKYDGPTIGERQNDAGDAGGQKKSSFRAKEKFSTPTSHEMINLREIQNLYSSNLFRLQIEELLDNVRIKEKYKNKFNDWYLKLNNNINLMEKLKPTNVCIIGAYSIGTTIGPSATIDIKMEIPSEFISKNDDEYTKQHTAYLNYVASIIHDDIVSEKSLTGDSSCPKLMLTPTGTLSKYIKVLVHFVSSVDSIKIDEANNLSIEMLKNYPSIIDGIKLLKIWLYQRQPRNLTSTFNGHCLTMFMIYLLKKNKINRYMSSNQVIRNFWINLSMSDWSNNGISLANSDEIKHKIIFYHQFDDCVFIDSTGNHNIAQSLTKMNYEWIKNQAKLAIECLDNNVINNFHVLFMTPVKFYINYDHLLIIDGKNQSQLDDIISTLKKGFNNRIDEIFIMPKQVANNESMENMQNKIYIGIRLNPYTSLNIIERGPTANDPEAIEFKNFWGDKSELRRFQDGDVCEVVCWEKAKTLADRRMICQKITAYLLKNKFNISKNEFTYIGNESDEFLMLKKMKIKHFSNGTGEEAALQVINVFSELQNELLSLTNLPLSIKSVDGTSGALRYTDVFPPLATIYKTKFKYAPAIDAVINLSSSNKWPKEIEAFRKTKIGFYIEISNCLRREYNLKTKVLTNGIIVFKCGFIFRLVIAEDKEIVLLKQINNNGVIEYKNNDESIEMEKKLFHLPKLCSALHALHLQKSSFGPTCCLVKRWLSAHLIDDFYIPEIVVELIVAYVYLSPQPYEPVHMPQAGFMRCLEFFSSHQWKTEPIIVNLNNQITNEEIITIQNHFATLNREESLPYLFISTPYDHLSSMWTINSPNKMILQRVSLLAKETLKLVDIQFNEGIKFNWRPMFKSPTNDYDVLIHLKDEFNSKRYQSFDLDDDSVDEETWHPYKQHTEEEIPLVEFDPVECYLKELRTAYGDIALFFHDKYGGSMIGVLIKPFAMVEKKFQISNVNYRKLYDNDKLILNLPAIIEDFTIIGRDLVDDVKLQTKLY